MDDVSGGDQTPSVAAPLKLSDLVLNHDKPIGFTRSGIPLTRLGETCNAAFNTYLNGPLFTDARHTSADRGARAHLTKFAFFTGQVENMIDCERVESILLRLKSGEKVEELISADMSFEEVSAVLGIPTDKAKRDRLYFLNARSQYIRPQDSSGNPVPDFETFEV